MNIKSLFTKKRIIYGLIGLVVISGLAYMMFFNKNNKQETLVAHSTDFLQQVSASGKIVAKENLNLSFEEAGQVSGVYVNVGDNVTAGQLLSNENTGELNAQLSEMQAGIDLQKAKLNQLLAGASPEDVQTAQDAVTSAQQGLNNSYASSLTALNGAYNAIYNAYTTASFIQLNYFITGGDKQSFLVQDNKKAMNDYVADAKKYLDMATNSSDNSTIDISINNIITDLNNTYASLTIIRQQCEEDVYYARVSAADKTSLDTQKTNITTALTSVTTAKSTISSSKVTLLQAEDMLTLKKAPIRDSDAAVFEAQIKQAEASEQNVMAQLRKKRIYSPIDGIVTAVNAKVGSVFSPNDTAVSVISKNNFQIESYVPEINISLIKVGNPATVTLDAYGNDTLFAAKVISIDPAETIKDGVSTYKVTLEFTNNDDRIKSGMTGNIIMTTLEKPNIISIPQGIVKVVDGKKFVKVKDGENSVDKEVQTGSISSSGNIEITSGLKEGDIVILK